jgi:anaerobic magnesium-protoporphyrin IX monomethyl ester cyclase
MDALFVEPNTRKSYQEIGKVFSAIETPTWSLLLAQSCRAKGFGVGILDANALNLQEDEAAKAVGDAKPRLVVMVVYGQNPNSGTTNMRAAYMLAKKIKQHNPDTPICFVGSHTSALPREVMMFVHVDFVLLNEGVYALHNLLRSDLKSPEQLAPIKGIGWKPRIRSIPPVPFMINAPEKVVPQDRMDIDLPGYAWDLLPYDKKPLDLYRAHFWHSNFDHDQRTPFASIYTSLGCRFGCDFCMINILNREDNSEGVSSADSRKMRFWSTEFITKEFEKLSAYGVETLRIADEMFFLDKRYFEPLLNNFIDRELPLNMWTYSRIDTVRDNYLELFKKAGVNWLALGVEAANQTIRQEISKGKFTDVNIREVSKKIQSSDINIISNYIFGFEDDTQETMQETLDLSLELNTEMANFYPCQALPGSPMHARAKLEGKELPESPEEYGFLTYEAKPLATKHCTSEEVLKFRDDAWQKYFTNPDYLELVDSKFGPKEKQNVIEMASVNLKRKILGD